MKTMKRFMALAIALILSFALAIPASAAPTALTTEGTVKIENASAGNTYTFYRVFDIGAVLDNNTSIYVTNNQWTSIENAAKNYVTVTDGIVTGLDTFNASKAQQFAADVINSLTNGVEVKATTSGATVTQELQYGYYIMKSVSHNGTANANYTVFTLPDTTDKDTDNTFKIEEKNMVYPQIEKKVNDLDATSASFGETLTYTITITAGAGTDTYSIKDTLPAFLKENSITNLDATTSSTATVADPTYENHEITWSISGEERAKLKDGDTITLSFTAVLDTDAAIYEGVNTNTVTLQYAEEGTEKTKTADATVYVGKIVVTKYKNTAAGAETTDPLSGAGFTLYSNEACTDEYKVADEVTTGADGTATFSGLKAGTYYLKETAVPSGYVGAEITSVTITGTTDGVGNITAFANGTATVYNTPGVALPETGGIGTTLFYAVGGVLVLGAVVLLLAKKRMSEN